MVAQQLEREIVAYRLILGDARTPKLAKWLLGLAIAYTLFPFDLIPDFLPVIGHVDDLIIVPALVLLALKIIPQEVVEECRLQAISNQESWLGQPKEEVCQNERRLI